MSAILIRKHCQPVLDEAGYPMFYCSINDRYEPNLMIYTSCGKPFVHIHGVQFSKWKPTVEECHYSGALLQQWLDRHMQDFEDYVDAYTEYFSTKPPPAWRDEKTIKDVCIEVEDYKTCRFTVTRKYIYEHDDGKKEEYLFTFRTAEQSGEVTYVDWPHGIPLTPASIATKCKVLKSYQAVADKLLAEYGQYKDLEERYEEARERIKTCSI